MTTARIRDIMALMNTIAAPALAEQWDNVGLQVGHPDGAVQSIWLALDPSPLVVEAACQAHVDLLITHHPLLLKPIPTIDFNSVTGKIIFQAARHDLAIFSAHTNLDSAVEGINHVLAEIIGLEKPAPMVSAAVEEIVKLVLFVPLDFESRILEALFQTPAGRIGAYSCCSFIGKGEGTFLPGSQSKPFSGEAGRLSRAAEVRIETIVPAKAVAQVVAHVKKHHPYETMAYDIYPLAPVLEGAGMGRTGSLGQPMDLATLSLSLKKKLHLPTVRIAGRKDLPVKTAAVCSGSGSSLVNRFLSLPIDVFISGDFRYHDARAIEEAGRGLIDIGHFASEHLILNHLAARLGREVADKDFSVQVDVCPLEKDPFQIL